MGRCVVMGPVTAEVVQFVATGSAIVLLLWVIRMILTGHLLSSSAVKWSPAPWPDEWDVVVPIPSEEERLLAEARAEIDEIDKQNGLAE